MSEMESNTANLTSSPLVIFFVENNDNDFGTIVKRTLHNNFVGLFFGLPFTKLNPDFVQEAKRQFTGTFESVGAVDLQDAERGGLNKQRRFFN
ncbi:hypothetical protein HPP92_027523 [Vanilla planifolia]|uniref:Uncharacterized protein n=1 Tax=Vanilla planifolia TaxID=51239 RepID=A0A835U7K3_VANPL|nr:hypothetical protein HPP92_027523 [Vanilla planifolia]